MSRLAIARLLAFLGLLATTLGAGAPRTLGAEEVEVCDAVALNKELIGNELKAESLKGKTLDVSGGY